MRYGRPLSARLLGALLSVVSDESSSQMLQHGRDAVVLGGEFDYVSDDMLEFSAYSPSELPNNEKLTWHLLKNVVDVCNTRSYLFSLQQC